MDSKEKVLDNSLESTMDMTQEEIEKLLAQTESEGRAESLDIQDADLESLLAGLDSVGDSNVQDISMLLNKADNNEAVDADVLALLKQQEETGETAYDAMDLFSGETPKKEGFFKKLLNKFKKKESVTVTNESETEKPKKNKKEKKAKKEKQNPVEVKETVTETETPVKKKAKKKNEKNTKIKENPETIDELDDIKEKSKPQKEKAAKKKKEKPAKVKEKKTKEKKDSPEKIREKEKTSIEDVIEELEEEQTEMPHKKKIIMVFAASILIMLGFLVVNYYFTGHANKCLAEEAYEGQDYLECYQLLYGQRLNDSQSAMFHRSELILKTDIFWRDYTKFAKENKWLEGLDELTQFVYQYPALEEYATRWNCMDKAEESYQKVQNILKDDYETDVQTVYAIAELEDDVDYTRELLKIVQKKEKKDELNQKYPDLLPEEEEMVAEQ